MKKGQGTSFRELVERALQSNEEPRSLWLPTSQEFDRSGPEAAKQWLESERQRLEQRVENLLKHFDRE